MQSHPTNDTLSGQAIPSIERMLRYFRAFGCAKFSRIEWALVSHLFWMGWVQPRFSRGESKPQPIPLSPSVLAGSFGFTRPKISTAIKRLESGGVIVRDADGDFTLNPRWQSWRRAEGGIRVQELCYPYIETGFPPDHACPDGSGSDPVPDREPGDDDEVPAPARPGAGHPPRDEAEIEMPNDLMTHANRPAPLVPKREHPNVPERERPRSRAFTIDAREEEENNSENTPNSELALSSLLSSENYSGYIYPHITEYIEYISREDCLSACIIDTHALNTYRTEAANQNTGYIYENSDKMILDGDQSARTVDRDGAGDSSTSKAIPDPESRSAPAATVNGSSQAGKLTPVVTNPARPIDRAALQANLNRLGGCYEGDVKPDPEILRQTYVLCERSPSGQALKDDIYLNKYVFPSDWIQKALKRALIKVPRLGNFGYLRRIMQTWQAAGGPDAGPEDDFDALLRPIGPTAVKFDPAANTAPITPEDSNRLFWEGFKKLYPEIAARAEKRA